MMKKKLIFITSTFLVLFFFSACARESADYLSSGIKDFESGDYESAIANLRRAKYLSPESFKANFYLGKSFLKTPAEKDSQYKARSYLNAAKELAKTSEERFNVSLTLLSIYETQKDYYKINRECRSLIEKDRKLIDKKKAYELYALLADSYFNMGEYKEASETYEYLVQSFPEELEKNPEVMAKSHIQLAAALIKTDKDQRGNAQAYVNISVSFEKDTFSNEYKMAAAKCYVILGDHFQDEDLYEISRVYHAKAKAYYDYLGDNDNSEQVARKIEKAGEKINKDCKTYECLMKKGEKQMTEKDYGDAVDYFKDAEDEAETRPEKAEAIAKLGIAFFLDGNEDKALSKFDVIKAEYGSEYKKLADKERIDLFMGASVILTLKNPGDVKEKLLDKAKNLFGNNDDKRAIFVGKIELAEELIDSATKDIDGKSSASYVQEAADVCERVGECFEKWEMKEEAKKFYGKASEYYGQLFEKDKVVSLRRKLMNLE